jgi:hypothetical protein
MVVHHSRSQALPAFTEKFFAQKPTWYVTLGVTAKASDRLVG